MNLKTLFIIYDAFSKHIWQPNPSQIPVYQKVCLSKHGFRHQENNLYQESER